MSDSDVDPDTPGYPPRRHLLRELPFDMVDVAPDASSARLELTGEMAEAGRLATGPVLVVTDVIAGLLVGRAIAPDWMATAQLALHLVDLPHVPGESAARGVVEPAVNEVVVDAVVRRAGRSTVVVDAQLSAHRDGELVGAPGSVGVAQLTFVRLPRRDSNLDIADTPVRYGERVSMGLEDSGLRVPYAEAIGLAAIDGAAVEGDAGVGPIGVGPVDVGAGSVSNSDAERSGSMEIDVTPFIQNSFGAVNGGVVASLAVAAAVRASSAVLGDITVALDVTATYLSQGRVGPLRGRAAVLRRCGPTVLCRVEVTDRGQLDEDGEARVVVIAHVLCAADSSV